jgi:hypothetical protein
MYTWYKISLSSFSQEFNDMNKRRQINTHLPADVSQDLEDLQAHFAGIPFTHIIRIAVRRLALIELGQNQKASSVGPEKAA